jgi:protoporphyrinogen oxidase
MNTKKNNKKIAIIIGAGPAGLTAAYELLAKTDIKPIIIESDKQVGGIAKTINYNGWRFDIGPHRFFSKNLEVSKIWEETLPLQGTPTKEDLELNRKVKLSNKFEAPNPEKTNKVSLSKNRLTRIYHQRKFFDYPIKLTLSNLYKIGVLKIVKIIVDYFWVKIKPIEPEVNLEDFFTNRFGRALYLKFFKDYTEKVWGVSCQKIPKSWGAQRIKKLSVSKVISESVKNIFKPKRESKETSLINHFIYPKLGAGQMYEEMAKIIKEKGGIIKKEEKVILISLENNYIKYLTTKNNETGLITKYTGDYFFSSLAIKNLIKMTDKAPLEIKNIAKNLRYRDLILIIMVYNKLELKNKTKIKTKNNIIPDNWIYIQEKNIKMGRLDIFNNFSSWLLKDRNKILIAAEYFCNKGDLLWNSPDKQLIKMCQQEFKEAKIAKEKEFIQGFVHRQEKAYPAYLGSYDKFENIKKYLNSINNLYSIGRNGQHRYNNMDHSMLTAIKAVENIISNNKNKENIWEVNSEEEYHEEK